MLTAGNKSAKTVLRSYPLASGVLLYIGIDSMDGSRLGVLGPPPVEIVSLLAVLSWRARSAAKLGSGMLCSDKWLRCVGFLVHCWLLSGVIGECDALRKRLRMRETEESLAELSFVLLRPRIDCEAFFAIRHDCWRRKSVRVVLWSGV